ncbi:MAG: DUF4190 domain-containing protein [Anaerolineales bacterium]|nr:DUF4190 domain-containing protein [Anaerolineales bacterium]
MSWENPSGSTPYSTPNSSLALISLITGILGLTFFPLIGSIVAIVTGMMARKEIRESGGALGGDGLATAGLVLGWIGVGLGVIGLCVVGVIFALPLCFIPLGIMSENMGFLLPVLLAF